jgi:hypothetical protein
MEQNFSKLLKVEILSCLFFVVSVYNTVILWIFFNWILASSLFPLYSSFYSDQTPISTHLIYFNNYITFQHLFFLASIHEAHCQSSFLKTLLSSHQEPLLFTDSFKTNWSGIPGFEAASFVYYFMLYFYAFHIT